MPFSPQGTGSAAFGSEIDLGEMATIEADRIVGRANGAGTGVPQALTLAQALALLGGGSAPTGTGVVVRATSPTLVTPALGTPSALVLTNATGLPWTGIAGFEASSGALLTPFVATELLTIAAAATTDTAATFTAGDFILGVACRVTVVIPTAATFDIGVAGATTRFGTGIAVAANTTNAVPGAAYSPQITAAGAVAIRVTPNAQPADNSGRLRIVWWGLRPTAPTA